MFFCIIHSIYIYSIREVQLLLKIYIVTAFIGSLNIIYNYILGVPGSWYRYSIIIQGIAKDENYVSAYLLPAITIGLFYALYANNVKIKIRIILIIITIIIMFGCFLAGSRTAIITMFGILLYIAIIYLIKEYKNPIKVITILIFGLIFFYILYCIIINFVPENITERIINYSSYSDDVRFEWWRTSMELFYKYPIFGAGLNATSSMYSFYSHSVLIDILTGQGLIGIIIILLIIFNLTRVKKVNRPLMLILIISSFIPYLSINGQNTASFWLPLILCQILYSLDRLNVSNLYLFSLHK